jgi:hypothetical protein
MFESIENPTFLTTEELAERLKYNSRYINAFLKDKVLFEGKHYVRPFGGRKILYIWEAILSDMHKPEQNHGSVSKNVIPLANGGFLNG